MCGVQGYKELYSKKWAYTQELAISIDGGLQKMFEAKADVNKMKAELAIKNQELAVAAKEAEALLKQVRGSGNEGAEHMDDVWACSQPASRHTVLHKEGSHDWSLWCVAGQHGAWRMGVGL